MGLDHVLMRRKHSDETPTDVQLRLGGYYKTEDGRRATLALLPGTKWTLTDADTNEIIKTSESDAIIAEMRPFWVEAEEADIYICRNYAILHFVQYFAERYPGADHVNDAWVRLKISDIEKLSKCYTKGVKMLTKLFKTRSMSEDDGDAFVLLTDKEADTLTDLHVVADAESFMDEIDFYRRKTLGHELKALLKKMKDNDEEFVWYQASY